MGRRQNRPIFLLTKESNYAEETSEPLQSGKTVQPQFVQDEADQRRPAGVPRRVPTLNGLLLPPSSNPVAGGGGFSSTKGLQA